MPASTVGTTELIKSAAASTASVTQARRSEIIAYHVRLMATWSHDRDVSVGVRPTTFRGQDAELGLSCIELRPNSTVSQSAQFAHRAMSIGLGVVPREVGDTQAARAFRRSVVVVQGDAFNASSLWTVVCVVLTSDLKWGEVPGNVHLPGRATSLEAISRHVSQLVTIDRTALTDRSGRLSEPNLEFVLAGIDVVLGRG